MLTLADKVHDRENCSRRNNLVVYGVLEDGIETPDLLKVKVIDKIFYTHLGVHVSTVKIIGRLGRLVKLNHVQTFEGFMISMRNFQMLEYSQEVREKKDTIFGVMKITNENKENNVKPLFDKMVINGSESVWDR